METRASIYVYIPINLARRGGGGGRRKQRTDELSFSSPAAAATILTAADHSHLRSKLAWAMPSQQQGRTRQHHGVEIAREYEFEHHSSSIADSSAAPSRAAERPRGSVAFVPCPNMLFFLHQQRCASPTLRSQAAGVGTKYIHFLPVLLQGMP